MTKKEKLSVCQAVEIEGGMDYTFRYYSNFENVKDKKFHQLLSAYRAAAREFQEYIGLEEE